MVQDGAIRAIADAMREHPSSGVLLERGAHTLVLLSREESRKTRSTGTVFKCIAKAIYVQCSSSVFIKRRRCSV